MKLVSVAEMIAIEREANSHGLTYENMMENAGRGIAEVILDQLGYMGEEGALGLVGSGNNGGDTLIALTYLAEEQWPCSAYIVRPRPEDDPLITRLKEAGGQVFELAKDKKYKKLDQLIEGHGLLVDGILGTGIQLPLKAELADFLDHIRDRLAQASSTPIILAVDCPSGIDCDSGEAAPECISADITVTMAAIKQGLFRFPAYNLLGELHLVGIGLPSDGEALHAWQEVNCIVPDIEWVRDLLPKRPLDSHKGTFGTALVIAGSVNYTGAALLSGKAAYRAGAGLVTLAVPIPIHTALAGHFTEATWLLLPHEIGVISESAADIIKRNLERTTALLVGPGFGLEDTTGSFLDQLLTPSQARSGRKIGFVSSQEEYKESKEHSLPPMVVDADGLKLLSKIPNWMERLPASSILTPHPGEMAVLTGSDKETIQDDRLGNARQYSQKWGHIVVLKGAFTVIAAPDGQAAVIPVATPALARAGTGDVLAGLIVGLRAQGLAAFHSAVIGAWIHAQAGLLAAQSLGSTTTVLAGDVLNAIVDIYSDLE